ncbi:hypothetical protein LJC27_04890 [Christensenellaceae bacterium OttesenSCG-928-M15]|nr:hypothetical protein [Christensenellaceae bacterium OttesenSCG-928-M15]
MQFIDKASITIKSGDGGNGCVAFHREKYVSRGGPSGGDGGRGGDIVFVADERLTTLLDFKYKRHFMAERGEDGKAELMSGKDGEDLLINVPLGTVVRDKETGAVIADMSEPNKKRRILRGGFVVKRGDDLHLRQRLAARILLLKHLALAAYAHDKLFRERVHAAQAHAVQAA